MIQKTTMTLHACGHALRRAAGFAITVSGFAVIALHGLQHVAGA
jgi:hypothetical protein